MARYWTRSYDYYSYYPQQPSMSERAQSARAQSAKLQKKGQALSPVVVSGKRTIANTFWGKAWCQNLESYSDYSNRLPRGRSYVRAGCVLDLKIAAGTIAAQVQGSSLYQVRIDITKVAAERWQHLVRACAGQIESLVELLQGRLPRGVMELVTRKTEGLFPAPKEIKLNCSCPDWATMCKHVAAALYGIGVRLDDQPDLLFVLREVDPTQLLAHAGSAATRPAGMEDKVLAGDDLSALFGIELEAERPAKKPAAAKKSGDKTKKPAAKAKKPVAKVKKPVAKARKAPVKKKPAKKKA